MKQITGTFQDAAGNPIAGGKLYLKISNDAVAPNAAQVSRVLTAITLDGTGSIPAGTQIWFNDEVLPNGTTYTVAVVQAGGGLVWGAENISIAGASPQSLNNAVPAGGGVSQIGVVLLNPLSTQTITNFPLVVPVLGFGSPIDTGFSRQSAGIISVGNGTQGDQTGTLSGNFFLIKGSGNPAYSTPNTGVYAWSSTGSASAAADTGFSRVSAGVIAAGNGTQGDFSGTLKCAAVQGPGLQKQVFSSGGTFTIPTGITQVKVTVVAGGGGGGGAASVTGNVGAGGGAGGWSVKWLTGLTPGNTLTVTVGASVSGGTTAGTNGTAGNPSSVASGTQTITTISTNGGGAGAGGTASNVAVSGGLGGAAGSGGDRNFGGGTGGCGVSVSSVGTSGAGGNSLYGGGGNPVGASSTLAGNGGNGLAPGAGGGGAGGNVGAGGGTGGTGAAGEVLFEWVS